MSGSIKQKLKYKRERFHMTSWLPYCQRDVYTFRSNVVTYTSETIDIYVYFRTHFRASEHDRQTREDKKLRMHFKKVKKRKTTHCCYRRVCLAFHVTKNRRIEAQLILYNFIQFEIHGKQILIHKHPVLQGTGRRECFKFTRMQSV